MSRRGRVTGVVSILCGLQAAWGCRDFIDHGATGDGCHSASDCQDDLACHGSVCSTTCSGELECPTSFACSAGRCVAKALATPSGDAAFADEEGAACSAMCGALDLCRGDGCTPTFEAGPSAAGSTTYSVQPISGMYCVQIKGDGDICGTVTGIGVLFELAVQGDLRLGLYDDGAGSPTTRLGQSADIHLDGVASVDAALEQPALIQCEPRIHAVWVCLASSAGSMKLKAIPNSTSNWAEMDAHAAMIADWLDSGVPDSWSGTALFPASVTPNVYLWIAP